MESSGRYDQRMFSAGDAYERYMGRWSRALAPLLVEFAGVRDGDAVLDVPDPARALSEMIRVTRSGGVVAAAVWEYGEGMEMLRTFWDEAVSLDPDADAKDERHMPLSRGGELAELWRAHGLSDVRDEALAIDTLFSSFDDYWMPFLEKQGPAGAYVAGLSEAGRATLQRRLRHRLLGGRPDGAIALRARAWAVRGVVPARARCGHRPAAQHELRPSLNRTGIG